MVKMTIREDSEALENKADNYSSIAYAKLYKKYTKVCKENTKLKEA